MSATEENLNLLLSKVMTDKYCSGEASDFDACIQHFVPQHIDGSFVDQSLQRKGLQRCGPYKEAVQRCMQDDSKHKIILRQAAKAPTCEKERKLLNTCQSSRKDCTAESTELLFCGLVHIVQARQKKQGSTPVPE